VAGTATAVSGHMQNKQAQQQAAQQQAAQAAYDQGAADQQAAAAPAADPYAELERLGQLHADGILTDEEFAAQKAKILG
jgi:hypothetical protein